MQRNYSFFWEMWKIKNVKNVKTILQKVKYGVNENQKCDFRGWFYKFVGTSGYFFKKITKRSSKFAFFVKKYEICDFGGWFHKFLSTIFSEMGENSFGCRRKKSKKILEKCEMSFYSSENKNWTFRGSFGNFRDFFLVFVGIVYFYTRINEYFSQHVWCSYWLNKKRVYCSFFIRMV